MDHPMALPTEFFAEERGEHLDDCPVLLDPEAECLGCAEEDFADVRAAMIGDFRYDPAREDAI